MPRRVILTGPPGGGKTVLAERLAVSGIQVVPEAATEVIFEAQAGGQPEPWTDPLFTERIAVRQRQRADEADESGAELILFDRSPLCTLALARFLRHLAGPELRGEVTRLLREPSYDRTVLFLQPLGFITPTAARRIDYRSAVEFGEMHREVYIEFGFDLADVPAGTVAEREAVARRIIGAD